MYVRYRMGRVPHTRSIIPAFQFIGPKFKTPLCAELGKGKGIWFIVLYPPKCSHDLPPLAGTVHTETISIPWGIFQSNWHHIAHTHLSTALFMLGTHFAAG